MIAAVIVQARMASTRLPGKVLLPLGDGTVLDQVLMRCQAIREVDRVVCAIPDTRDCDTIATTAGAHGVDVFRGSTEDVLARHLGAAKAVDADFILRVTSDCPMIDPAVCADVLSLVRNGGADFACNNMPPLWPHGLDCEAVTIDWLARAESEATDSYAREHVMPWIRNHAEVRKVNLVGPGGNATDQRWTIDEQSDYEFLRAIWPLLPAGPEGWAYRTPLDIVNTHPGLTSINAGKGRLTEWIKSIVGDGL